MKNQFLFDFPIGSQPFPAVIIAPGLRYPMDGPIFKELIRIFVEKGFVVARLNWSFYLENPVKGMPSENLQTELAELRNLSTTTASRQKSRPLQHLYPWKIAGFYPCVESFLR
ncbi:hypothetical protein ACO0K7_00595 [Undibacterium sp. Ji67W]|uniref:hypothetical protein n=1 Tax=Undibacterium sp. Ji67W TaxID=3413042 RepID=UPI003BF2E221